MNFPKLSTVHFLALSLALNVVLLGLVCYLFQVEAPKSVVVTAPAPVVANPVATRVASENTEYARVSEPSVSPVAPAVSYGATEQASTAPSAQPRGSWSAQAEFSAATPVPSAEVSSAPPAVVHDANAPGNSFRFKDVVVAVEGESDDIEGTGPGLLVSVSEAAPQVANEALSGSSAAPATTDSTAAAQDPAPTSQDQAVTPGNGGSSTAAALRRRSGSPFTLEEELFRAKWGWGAFNAAQSAAAQAQNAASPAQ